MKDILLIAFSIGFLLSFTIIYNYRHWRKPRFWLGMLILSFSFILLEAWGSIIELQKMLPFFDDTHYRCLMMIPICIWMYINGLANSNKVQIGTYEKILFAFLCLELATLIFIFFSNGELLPPNFFLALSTSIEFFAILNSMVVAWKANQTLNNLKEKIRNNYSDGLEQSYNWLKEFLYVLASLLPLWLFVVIAYFFVDIDVNTWYQFIWIPLSILIFYIVIRASSTKEILHDFELETGFTENLAIPISTSDSKMEINLPYKLMPTAGKLQVEVGPNINEKDKALLLQLIKLVNEKQLFKIKRLNINNCAQQTGISKKEISRLVNYYLQLSFSDFINFFRIEDFSYKVSQGEAEKFSLVDIALASGFSSKSNVYYNFKKLTNSSPIQIVNQFKNTQKG